jgi:hypothetical protein
MRDGKKEYKIAQVAAAAIGCHLPEEHIFHSTIANTSAFIREYFFLKGWEECQKEYLQKSRKVLK